MDSPTVVTLIVVCLGGGFLAGCIGYSRVETSGAFVAYFLLGALFPLIGIIAACFAPRPAPVPQAPGWYADPWGQAPSRWWDGYQWTWQTEPVAAVN